MFIISVLLHRNDYSHKQILMTHIVPLKPTLSKLQLT